MFRKTIVALVATLALAASFSAANAQRGCVSGEEGLVSAYPAYSQCR